MTLLEKVMKRLKSMPLKKQKAVLAYIDTLDPNSKHGKLNSLEGLWADLGFSLSESDIADARREMWESFPRNI